MIGRLIGTEGNAAMRRDDDLDLRRIAGAVAEAHVVINKADKGLYSIQ